MATETSAWLTKLEKMTPEQREALGWSDEDFAAAKKEHLLERDYTQSKQKLAAYAKLQEQYPDATPEQIAQLVGWYMPNSAEVQRLWTNRERLVERQEPAAAAQPAGKKKWRDVEAGDLYETAALRALLEDHHADTVDAAYKRWNDEYRAKEVPRLDQVAAGYLDTVIGLVDFATEDAVLASRDPKHQRMPLDELVKQAASRATPGQRADFRKIAQAVRDERLASVKPIEEDAYKRGVEEGRKLNEGPSGPLGGARPGAWKDTTESAPKTRDELLAKIVSAVESNPKHGGRPVPL